MHQIRFRLGLRPTPRWRRLQRSPRPLAVFEGSTSKRRERGGEKGKGKKINGREGVWCGGRDWAHPKNFGVAPLRQTASPLAGRGREREGRRTEREKRGRKQEKGKEGKLEQGRRLGKGGPG